MIVADSLDSHSDFNLSALTSFTRHAIFQPSIWRKRQHGPFETLLARSGYGVSVLFPYQVSSLSRSFREYPRLLRLSIESDQAPCLPQGSLRAEGAAARRSASDQSRRRQSPWRRKQSSPLAGSLTKFNQTSGEESISILQWNFAGDTAPAAYLSKRRTFTSVNGFPVFANDDHRCTDHFRDFHGSFRQSTRGGAQRRDQRFATIRKFPGE